MTYLLWGGCPRCGAPIYTYAVWMAVVPPPPLRTCDCFPSRTSTMTRLTSAVSA